jgi:hypothetical protein
LMTFLRKFSHAAVSKLSLGCVTVFASIGANGRWCDCATMPPGRRIPWWRDGLVNVHAVSSVLSFSLCDFSAQSFCKNRRARSWKKSNDISSSTALKWCQKVLDSSTRLQKARSTIA